jgi:anti-sigma factor RsiW
VVAAFAVRQWRRLVALGIRTSGAPASVLDEAPPTEVVEVRRPFKGDPADAWAVITDDNLYADLAQGLADPAPGGGPLGGRNLR